MLRRNILMVFISLALSLFGVPAHAGKAPPTIRVIITATEEEAREVLKALQGGGSFAELAAGRPAYPSANRFGELSVQTFEELPQPVAAILPRLKEGQTSEVILWTDGRYALVHVVDLSRYRAGAKAFRAGDFKSAEKQLELHTAANPDAVKARLMLSAIAEKKGDRPRVAALSREVLAIEPANAEAAQRLAALERIERDEKRAAEEKTAKADAAVRPVDDEKIDKTERTVKVARVDAEKTGKRAAEKKPEHLPLPLPSPEVRKEELIRHEPVTLRLIVLPAEQQAHEALAEVKAGRPFGVVARERSFDAKSRQLYGLLDEVDVSTMKPVLRTAIGLLKPGEMSGVLQVSPAEFVIVQKTTLRYLKEAQDEYRRGNLAQADELFEKHVALNPVDTEALMLQAKIRRQLRKLDAAEVSFRRAIAIDPGLVSAYEALGLLLLDMRKYAAARDIISTGLAQVPSSAPLRKLFEIAEFSLIGE